MRLPLPTSYSPETFESRPLFRFYHVTEHLYLFSLAAHIFLLALFLGHGVLPMVWYNCFSIIAFGFAIHLNRSRRHYAAFVLGIGEVILHAILAAWFVGIAAGFHLTILALGPCMFLLPSARQYPKWLLLTFFLAVFLAVHLFLADHVGPYAMGEEMSDIFFLANIVILSISLSLLTYYLSRASWAAESYITYLTQIDSLTGILNRRGIEAALGAVGISRAPAGEAAAVLMCDIDDFKLINDSHGHDVGDRVLKETVVRMEGALRASDRIGRWGGEEFLVLLPGTGLEGARIAAEKILAAVSSPTPAGSLDGEVVTLTIGATEFRPGEPVADCVKRADAALYRGKLAGKNRVVTAG